MWSCMLSCQLGCTPLILECWEQVLTPLLNQLCADVPGVGAAEGTSGALIPASHMTNPDRAPSFWLQPLALAILGIWRVR